MINLRINQDTLMFHLPRTACLASWDLVNVTKEMNGYIEARVKAYDRC